MRYAKKGKPITFKAEESYHYRLSCIMERNQVSKTEALKGLIDAGYFMGRAETTVKCVELMDAIEGVRESCEPEAYKKLYAAGGGLCQYLLPN